MGELNWKMWEKWVIDSEAIFGKSQLKTKWSFSLHVRRYAIFIMTYYEMQSFNETRLSSLKRRSIWDQAELSSSFQSWDIAKNVKDVETHFQKNARQKSAFETGLDFLLFTFFSITHEWNELESYAWSQIDRLFKLLTRVSLNDCIS